MRTIITGGAKYTDIDVLACSIGYEALLRLEGKEAQAVLKAPFNATIPSFLVDGLRFNSYYSPCSSDRFVIVDVSDPKHFEGFVQIDQVVEVFDHHFGYEVFWKKRLGLGSRIEPVGSCATLIWEEINNRGKAHQVSQKTLELLLASIVSNTLNFQVSITTKRDKEAFAQIQELTSLPPNWTKKLFCEALEGVLENVTLSIERDTKHVDIQGECLQVAQLELWDASTILKDSNLLKRAIRTLGTKDSLLMIHGIQEGKTYFITKDPKLQNLLIKVLKISFNPSGQAVSSQLILRKEMLKKWMLAIPSSPSLQA